MLFFVSTVLASLLLIPSYALPTGSHGDHRPGFPRLPPVFHGGILCGLPIPVVQRFLCPRQDGGSPLTVSTPFGNAHGASDDSGTTRFAVKYANHNRWQASTVVTSWLLPNGQSDPTAMPMACPQTDLNSSAFVEDCLSMVLYVPDSVKSGSKAPTLMWIHGGSFTFGSANGPGLDGSKLATATNSIVAVIQYRLGALGLYAPSGETNLAVKDVMTAMTFLQRVLPSFGGDASQITIAGQSAGASMIRTLLAVPSAQNLFKQAILQSDTMDYGFYTPEIHQTLLNHFKASLSCSATDTTCLNALSLTDILNAESDLSGAAPGLTPAANPAEPLRPVHDGTLVTSTFTPITPFPRVNKPLLITTVNDEAGFTIYGGVGPGGLDPATYEFMVDSAFGQKSATTLLAFADYAVPASANSTDGDGGETDVTPQLQQMGTDQVWRCPSWTFARNWVSNGGRAFVGEFVVGASYPGNEEVPFCTDSGVVCHQDDIEIVFGTAPNPTPAQAALIQEIQARYSAFLRTGNPNTDSLRTWTAAGTSNVHATQLGASGEAPVGGCDPSLWGAAVPYDYQTLGL
ncbi:unnamed protein product [Somion occarium]|uniref:Carboxylic ester hydrolase n=2 Tax=Somion occarium TaxID=3059160 RepID=A0ABP1DCP9_9APHY